MVKVTLIVAIWEWSSRPWGREREREPKQPRWIIIINLPSFLPSLSSTHLYDPLGMANYYSSSGYAPSEPSSMGFYSAPSSSSSLQPSFYSSSLDPSTSSQQALGSISPSNGGQSTLPNTEGGNPGGSIMVGNWYNAFTPWTGISGQEPPLLQGR